MAISAAVPKATISKDAGYLLYGNLGSSLPTNTVSGSIFTDTWDTVGGWFLLGVTKEGHEFSYAVETDQITAAEYFDPLAVVTTGRTVQMKFELQIINMTTVRRMLNGGTLSTSGAGATLLSSYTPPAPGGELRCMLGWESQDNTERLVMEQAFQTGTLTIARKKGADNATLPVEFTAEIPASGFPYKHFGAGVSRG
jgi:hypothetical protein